MKRLFALILTLAMVCSLGMSASAANVGVGSSEVGEVKVAVVEGDSETATVYYVTVDWESLTFTYDKGGSKKVWKPESHSYETTTRPTGWDKTAADITVTNHSNTDIGVAMNFDGSDTTKTVSGVTATLSNHTFDLATGVDRTFAEADKASATVTVAGTPSTSNEFTIGMVKITISDK